jgi:uncharacterized protein
VTPSLELVLLLLGLFSGVVSGLLGIGGAIIIVPALLYIPQWVGIATIDIRTAAAIAVSQVVAATLTGAFAHSRHGLVHGRLGVVMSVAAASGALAGGVISAYLPSEVLLLVAAALATSAAGVMLVRPPRAPLDGPSHPSFNVALVFPAGVGIGLLIGTIGIGSFLLVPTLIFLCRIPTRIAMATVLAVAFPTSAAALAGKVATGQVPLVPALAIVVGAIPGAQLGSLLSARLSARVLRMLYGALVLMVAFGLWYDVFHTPSG